MSLLLFLGFDSVAPTPPPPVIVMSPYAMLVQAADRVALAQLGGEAVTYAPAIGSPVAITGIFDSNFVLVKGTALAGVEAGTPAVFLRISDLPVDPTTDTPTITIRGNDYRVIEHDPDDMGGIVLSLRLKT